MSPEELSFLSAILVASLVGSAALSDGAVSNVTKLLCGPGTCFGREQGADFRTSCCDSCTCEGDICYTYGIDCRRVQKLFPQQLSLYTTSSLMCGITQLRHLDQTQFIPNSQLLIFINNKCPSDYRAIAKDDTNSTLNETLDKCDNAETYAELGARVPVSDRRTGMVYMNKYCAACHGVLSDSVLYWSVRISCEEDHYWPSDYDHMVQDIEATSGCNILFDKPADVQVLPPTCTLGEFMFCNLTMTTQCFTEDVENEAVCHLTLDSGSSETCIPLEISIDDAPTFTLLVKYGPAEEHGESTGAFCEEGQFHDKFKNVCRELSCGPMRTLLSGACQSIVQTVSGAAVEFFLKMTPLRELSDREFQVVSDEILQFGVDFMQRFSFDIYSNTSLYEKSRKSILFPSSDIDLDYYALHVIVSIPHEKNVEADVLDEILNLHGTVIEIGARSRGFYVEFVQLEEYVGISGKVYMHNNPEDDRLEFYDSRAGALSAYPSNPAVTTLLSTSSLCPLITLPVDEFAIQNFSWGVKIPDLNTNVSKWNMLEDFISGQLASVRLCVNTYKSIIQPFIEIPISTTADTNTATSDSFHRSSVASNHLIVFTTLAPSSLLMAVRLFFC